MNNNNTNKNPDSEDSKDIEAGKGVVSKDTNNDIKEESGENTALLPSTGELSYPQAMWKTTSLSIPTVLSYTYSFNLVVLGIMGGRLGNQENEENYLGATILSSTTLNTVLLLAMSPFFAVAPHVKNHHGLTNNPQVLLAQQLKHKEQIAAALKQATLIAAGIGPIAIIPLLASEKMLKAFGQDHKNAELAADYLEPVALVVPAILLHLCTEQMLFAFDKQSDAMKIALTNFAIGTLLSYMLAFGEWGAPELGFPGLAYGLVIEEYMTLMMYCIYLHKHPTFREYKIFQAFKTLVKEDLEQIKSMLKIGIPITVTLLSELCASFLLTLSAGLLGKNAQAAYNISAQFTIFTMIPPLAFGQTTMQQVAGAIANNQITNARRFAISGVGSSLILISPICLAIIIDPTILEKVFSNSNEVDNDVLRMARQLAPIAACGVLADTVGFNILQVLRVTGDGNKATLIANISVWAGVGLAYMLGNLTSLEIVGVVLGYELSAVIGRSAALLPRWYERIKPEHLQNLHNELVNPSATAAAVKGPDSPLHDVSEGSIQDDSSQQQQQQQQQQQPWKRSRPNKPCCIIL